MDMDVQPERHELCEWIHDFQIRAHPDWLA